MKPWYKSRKFWLAIVSAFLLVLKEGLNIEVDSATILAFAGIVLGWIFTEGSIDKMAVKKKADST